MKTMKLTHRGGSSSALCVALAFVLLGAANCHAENAVAMATDQKNYESPDAAFKALMEGLSLNSDEKILDVLGHQNKDLVVQSDKEDSTEVRNKILNAAKEHLKIITDGDKAVVYLGLQAWPYPIPIVKQGNAWTFDTAAGKEEILNRRIGRNELSAIRFVDAYGDAQRKYASEDHTGDKVLKYAQKLIASKEKRDGLYWPVDAKSTDESSPLAAMVDADEMAFLAGNGSDIPYNGYYFKVLTRQGANPANGKYDYVINGNMIAGYAIVAWPADYGASGVMTLVMSHQGIIQQKDLGAETAKVAAAMDEYNPDNTWGELKPEDK